MMWWREEEKKLKNNRLHFLIGFISVNQYCVCLSVCLFEDSNLSKYNLILISRYWALFIPSLVFTSGHIICGKAKTSTVNQNRSLVFRHVFLCLCLCFYFGFVITVCVYYLTAKLGNRFVYYEKNTVGAWNWVNWIEQRGKVFTLIFQI